MLTSHLLEQATSFKFLIFLVYIYIYIYIYMMLLTYEDIFKLNKQNGKNSPLELTAVGLFRKQQLKLLC
jgi:hypothetical protein